MLAFIGLTLIALIVYLLLRRRGPVNFPKNIMALFIIPFLIIPLDAFFFNGQLYDRGILYLVLIAPVVFVPLLMGGKRRYVRPVLVGMVALVVVACCSTLYYQEALYISNDQGIAATDFLAGEVPSTYVVGGYYPYAVWSGEPESYYRMKMSSIYDDSMSDAGVFYGSGTFLFDTTSELWYRQWGLQDMYEYYQGEASRHYRVYDNGDYWAVYVRGTG